MRKKRETEPLADADVINQIPESPINEENIKNTDEIGNNSPDTVSMESPTDDVPENDDEKSNEETFLKDAIAFSEESGIERTDVENGLQALREIRDAWRDGTLNKEMLILVMKGLEYDEAVKAAREAGELDGRNKQIEEKYMHPIESDGVPHLAGRNIKPNKSRISSIFDLARNA